MRGFNIRQLRRSRSAAVSSCGRGVGVSAATAPAWYEPVIPAVRAVVFDDASSCNLVVSWLETLSRSAEFTHQRTDAGLMVREQVDGSLRETLLRVGDLAVEAPGSRYGWDACPSRSFGHRYTLRPRELPVFETNDTAE